MPLLITPPPEILIVGCGSAIDPVLLRSQYEAEWARQLRGRGTSIEVLDTPNACSTFNLLSDDNRRVAAALLPVGQEHFF